MTAVKWHFTLLVLRSRFSRVCFLCAGFFALLVGLAALMQLPPFVGSIAALAGGSLVGFAVAQQMGEDMQSIWIERSLGVSHQGYIHSYERVTWVLAVVLLVIFTCAWAIPGLLGSTAPLDRPQILGTLTHGLKAGVVGCLPALIAPWLSFQIDVRRPLIAMMIIGIVGLFVGTAVTAHWLGVLLVPLLRYFANQSQEGRFYRA